MKTGLTWAESVFSSIISACNVAHEFSHCVVMIPGWSECIFLYEPSWREDNKVTSCTAWIISSSSKACENWRIWVVKWNWPDGVVFSQVVFIRSIVSVPAYNIKWGMIILALEKFSSEFCEHCPIFLFFLIPSYWSFKISWICHAVCTNWPQIRNNEVPFKYLTNITFSIPLDRVNSELDTSLDDCQFLGFNFHYTKFCFDQ